MNLNPEERNRAIAFFRGPRLKESNACIAAGLAGVRPVMETKQTEVVKVVIQKHMAEIQAAEAAHQRGK